MTEILVSVSVGWFLGFLSTLLFELRYEARKQGELLSRAFAVGERIFIGSDTLEENGVKDNLNTG